MPKSESEKSQVDAQTLGLVFSVFNEIGIINQLSRTLFEQSLPDNITVPHFSVLNHLVRLGDGKTPLSIASAFQVPKASMTNTLQGLESRNLINMRPNPKDGRGKLVYLTDKGRIFRDDAIQLIAPHVANLSDSLDFEQLLAILPALENLRQVLDQYRDQ